MSAQTFLKILNIHCQNAASERNKGDRFENLIQAYLQTDQKYAFQLTNVWLWSDFPFRDDLRGIATGIDLVAKTVNDEYWAIQCNGGVICFVSNGAWLDGDSTDGFRKVLEQEFDNIFVFNLLGNQRTSGKLSRKEGGKIFGSGSRTPIGITILVKKPK